MEAAPMRKHVTAAKRRATFRKYDGRCAYCGRDIDERWFQVDHIVPVHRGGSNDIGNLNPACPRCNQWKSGFTVDEFRCVVGFSNHGAPSFSEPQRKWLRENFASLGLLVDQSADHTFAFEEWNKEPTDER